MSTSSKKDNYQVEVVYPPTGAFTTKIKTYPHSGNTLPPSLPAPGEKYQLMSLAGGKHEKGKETRENMRK